MKTIRVFAVPSHLQEGRTGGVDFFRVIQPMKQLDGFEYNGYKFKVDVFDLTLDKHKTLFNAVRDHDILFLNYTTNDWGFAAMGAFARKLGKPIIMDVDDSLWDIMPDNPVFDVYKKGSQGVFNFTAICNEVDYVTTTNLYLKHVITHNTRKRHEHIKIFPNSVDLDTLYTHRSPFKDTLEIQLLHHGSTTHFIDLEEPEFKKAINRIMYDYPNVTFKTVGAFLPEYRRKWGRRYINAYGDRDYYKWTKEVEPKYMDEADIIVVPLHENAYTRCKSDIKFSESSSFVKPGVYQKIRQYEETIEDGVDGFLADTEDKWYNALKKLIEDAELRKTIATNAFNKVVKEKQAKDKKEEWAKFLIEVLDKQLNG